MSARGAAQSVLSSSHSTLCVPRSAFRVLRACELIGRPRKARPRWYEEASREDHEDHEVKRKTFVNFVSFVAKISWPLWLISSTALSSAFVFRFGSAFRFANRLGCLITTRKCSVKRTTRG